MHIFIELWKAKPSWESLSRDDRASYMTALEKGVPQIIAAGVEILGWGFIDADAGHRPAYDYYALYRADDREAVRAIERAAEEAGWYEYMEQINVVGELGTPDAVIAHQIGA